MNAVEAIRESITTGGIVHMHDFSAWDAEFLALTSEGDVFDGNHDDNRGLHEFWGTDPNGDAWRVHLHGVNPSSNVLRP